MTNVLLSTVIPALLTSLFLVGVLLILNPYLMLILVAMLPMLLVAGLISGRSVKSGVVIFQRAFETFSKGTLFALHHIELTQIQSSEATELRRQVGYLDNLRSTGESMGLRFAIHGQLQRTLTGLAIVALLVAGGTSVALGTMTLGEFLAFYVAAGLLNTYVNNALTALPQIITGNESMVTLYKLSTTDSAQPYTGTRRIDFEGRISVRSVFFSYGDERILENVDLELRPGTTTALVGSNGAGKSTLAHLILGLYRPSRGQLFADGIAYDELNISELRRNIGVVPQHPELFAGTIEENLCYGADGVGHKEAVQAARTVLIDDFVRSLPKGYDTEIGADGVLLSGGQCQRLALARALIREPTLLILDEPTNHLDAETIELVLKNIQCLRHRPAILLISHDSSVVSAADQVFALREGMFVEQPEPLSNCERQTA